MADKDEGEETTPRGVDWEVFSLTASTYAAAPGPDPKGTEKNDGVEAGKYETSNALFMSGHFVFPPSEHENLPLETESTEILDEQGGEGGVYVSIKEEGEKLYGKDEDNWNIGKLAWSDGFHGIPFFDKKGNRLTISDADFADSTILSGLNLAGKDQSIYNLVGFKFGSKTGAPCRSERLAKYN